MHGAKTVSNVYQSSTGIKLSRLLKNLLDSRFYNFCQFFRKGVKKLITLLEVNSRNSRIFLIRIFSGYAKLSIGKYDGLVKSPNILF